MPPGLRRSKVLPSRGILDMSSVSEGERWIAALVNEPDSPLFCMRARLTLEDEALCALARLALPVAGLSTDDRAFLELYARRFVRQGGGLGLSGEELHRVFASREALACFEATVERCLAQEEAAKVEERAHDTSRLQPDSSQQERGRPEVGRASSRGWRRLAWFVGNGGLAAAALILIAWLVFFGDRPGPDGNSPVVPADAPPSVDRGAVELIQLGGFDVTAEHAHGMFSSVLWKGAQEPGLRANPMYEYFSVGYCGLFATHLDNPPYREAAQAETRLIEFAQNGNECRMVYANEKYGTKRITWKVEDRVLTATCDLSGALLPVKMTTCGSPLFFRRVYVLTPGREENFNLAYQSGHRNFIDNEGSPVAHSEILLTNDTGSYAWLCRVQPEPRPLTLSSSAGLNGPFWALQPGDQLSILIGAESELRRLR